LAKEKIAVITFSAILILTGSLFCIFIFSRQRRWLFAGAYLSLAVYTIFDKIIKQSPVPSLAINLLGFVFPACITVEIYRRWKNNQRISNNS
jgi:uncharacterized membrane protein YfcA